MAIYYGVCVGSTDRWARYAKKGLARLGALDRVQVIHGAPSIFEGYNALLAWARDRDDLESLVLLHEDVEILTTDFEERVRGSLARHPRAGLIGAIGGVGATSIRWWESERRLGAVQDPRAAFSYGGFGSEVDVLDGMLLVLSREAVAQLRFDSETYTGFHGYDADICFTAAEAGFGVLVEDLPVFHHSKEGLGDRASHFRANLLFCAKWGLARPPILQRVQADRRISRILGPAARLSKAIRKAVRRIVAQRSTGPIATARAPDDPPSATVTPTTYGASERLDVLQVVPASARSFLDVGCSRGGFGTTLERAFRPEKLWGIEPDRTVAQDAEPRYHQLIVGRFPDDIPPAETFDCIVFNDVLEHMVDPWDALRAARAHLSDSGVVVASIPNVRFITVLAKLLFRGDFSYVDHGILDRTHLRFFTRSSLRELFGQSGYRVDVIFPSSVWGGRRWLAKLLPGSLKDILYVQFIVRAVPLQRGS